MSNFPKFIINPFSTFIKLWNLLIILMLIYTGIILPPRLAFDEETKINWLWVDIIIDSIFFTDILINFNLAYENEQG